MSSRGKLPFCQVARGRGERPERVETKMPLLLRFTSKIEPPGLDDARDGSDGGRGRRREEFVVGGGSRETAGRLSHKRPEIQQQALSPSRSGAGKNRAGGR